VSLLATISRAGGFSDDDHEVMAAALDQNLSVYVSDGVKSDPSPSASDSGCNGPAYYMLTSSNSRCFYPSQCHEGAHAV
jgi:hypothetical protein